MKFTTKIERHIEKITIDIDRLIKLYEHKKFAKKPRIKHKNEYFHLGINNRNIQLI
jgi:hypothetical protein